MKPTTLTAILFGCGVGIAAAVGGFLGAHSESPAPPPPAASSPIVEKPRIAAPAERASEPTQVVAAENLAGLPPEGDPTIDSKADFEAAAIACDKKDAGACRRAASAVELGRVVPKDLERAKTFRKVELTVLVRGCEKGTVEACLTLADRYLRGDGLAQNERTATALIEHARELCSRHPEEACRGVPKTP